MHSQLKLTGWWTSYAILLVLLSAGLYVYGPSVGPPEIWVTAEPHGSGPPGSVRLVFHTDRLVKDTLVLPFELKGEEGARLGRDFALVQKTKQAEIRAGTRDSAPLDLRKLEPPLPPNAVPEKKPASVVVALKPVEGFTLKPGASELRLPIEITDLGVLPTRTRSHSRAAWTRFGRIRRNPSHLVIRPNRSRSSSSWIENRRRGKDSNCVTG